MLHLYFNDCILYSFSSCIAALTLVDDFLIYCADFTPHVFMWKQNI